MGNIYKREVDLMDENLFPPSSEYRRKVNPKECISSTVVKRNVSDEDIIAAVSKKMANSLGAVLND